MVASSRDRLRNRKATIPQLQLLGTARWNLEKRKVTENGIVEFPNVLIHTHGMTETWNERLRCPICGSTGIASVSQRETDDTATIEDVPDRFKVVVTEHGLISIARFARCLPSPSSTHP